MSMKITDNYNNYPAYADTAKKAGGSTTEKTCNGTTAASQGVTYESTMPDSLESGYNFIKDLEKKMDGTEFFVGTVGYGQTYGNSSNINFVVNPKFLSKLGTDKEAQERFVKDVEFLNENARQFIAQQKSQGWEIVSKGYFCDENGNWGGWTIGRKTNRDSVLQGMTDKANKIREDSLAKKKEAEKLEDKKQDKEEMLEEMLDVEKECKERFGDKFKEISIFEQTEDGKLVNLKNAKEI